MMSREKIEEMARDIFAPKVAIDGIDFAFAAVHGADKPDSHFMRIAQHLYNAGYRKQSEWISVEERLPETKLETITAEDVKIGGGGQSIPCGTKEQFSSQVSEPVVIFSNHPQGAYIDIDRMIGGAWSNNWYVTHWMPLPEPPKKGGGE